MTRDEAIEKIRKVHTLTTSSNEHEAALALERTYELLSAHRLTLDDLTAQEIGRDELTRHGGWADVLLTTVASMCGCTVLLHREGSLLTASIFGTWIDRTTAMRLYAQMYETLVARREAAWAAHVASLMGPFGPHPATVEEGAAEEWMESYVYGAITKIMGSTSYMPTTLVTPGNPVLVSTPLDLVPTQKSRLAARDRAKQYVDKHYGHAITKVAREVTLDMGAIREGEKTQL